MDAKTKKDNVIAVLIVGIALAWIVYASGMFSVLASPGQLRGVVVSVTGPSEHREALVKLDQGDEVKAIVPSRCIVFPGYVVTLHYSGKPLDTELKYTVLSAKEGE